jgi:hypothetical protein
VRTLLIQTTHNEEFRVEIPDEAKVTFAGINPQSPHMGYALRVYETKEKQLACFTDVRSFRDTALRVQRKVKDTKNVARSERTKNSERSESERRVEERWEDVS